MSEDELDAIAEKIDAILKPLSDGDRRSVLHSLCTCYYCGGQCKTDEWPCRCWNDE